jgi:hypothetical protein
MARWRRWEIIGCGASLAVFAGSFVLVLIGVDVRPRGEALRLLRGTFAIVVFLLALWWDVMVVRRMMGEPAVRRSWGGRLAALGLLIMPLPLYYMPLFVLAPAQWNESIAIATSAVGIGGSVALIWIGLLVRIAAEGGNAAMAREMARYRELRRDTADGEQ